jgi:hypothetical protein
MATTSILSHFMLDPSYDHLARTGHCIIFLALVVRICECFKWTDNEACSACLYDVENPATVMSSTAVTRLLNMRVLFIGLARMVLGRSQSYSSQLHLQLISYSSFRGGWQLFNLKPIPSAYLSFTGHTLLSVQNIKCSDHVFSLCIEAMRGT